MYIICIDNDDDLNNYIECDDEEIIMEIEYVQDRTITDLQLKQAGEAKRSNLKYYLKLNNTV